MDIRAAKRHESHSTEHARNVAEVEMWWNPPGPDVAAWNTPIREDPPSTIEEMRMRESQTHVDHVRDMVPFWIKGVEAAEKGEVLRLEHYLETLQEASDTWLRSAPEASWMHAKSGQGWGLESSGHKNGRGDGWESVRSDGLEAWGVEARSTTTNGLGFVPNALRPRQKAPTAGGRKRERIKPQKGEGRGMFNTAFDFVEHVARKQSADEEQKRKMHTFFDVRPSSCAFIMSSFLTSPDAYPREN